MSSGKKMMLLEPTVYTQGKSGGVFASAMTYGIAKVKWKAVVRNPRANVRFSDANAVFYFYFEEKSAGLSHAGSGTSTLNEFTLLRFDVKGDTRETVVMKMNAFGLAIMLLGLAPLVAAQLAHRRFPARHTIKRPPKSRGW